MQQGHANQGHATQGRADVFWKMGILHDQLTPVYKSSARITWPLVEPSENNVLCASCRSLPLSPFLHCERDQLYCLNCLVKEDLYGEVIMLLPKRKPTKRKPEPLQQPVAKRFDRTGSGALSRRRPPCHSSPSRSCLPPCRSSKANVFRFPPLFPVAVRFSYEK